MRSKGTPVSAKRKKSNWEKFTSKAEEAYETTRDYITGAYKKAKKKIKKGAKKAYNSMKDFFYD